jgi:hypothetical protein
MTKTPPLPVFHLAAHPTKKGVKVITGCGAVLRSQKECIAMLNQLLAAVRHLKGER